MKGTTMQLSRSLRLWLASSPILVLPLLALPLAAQTAGKPTLPPLDPQRVEDQDDMTWADYHPIPGVDWTDPKHTPTSRTISIALVAADFDDQPFVITLPKHSDLFGNPQVDPIPREEVAKYYADFWNKPSDLNHHHTV